MDESVTTALVNQGPLGILCFALLVALRVVWKKGEDNGKDLTKKVDDLQQARLSDRDQITKQLIDSTTAISRFLEYVSSRRK